jgi:hypothetical protein
MQHVVHCKKRLTIFPSPAGTLLTKLSLAGNDLFIPGQNLVSDIPTGNCYLFYSVELIFCVSGHPGHPPHTHHPLLRPPHHGARHTLCIQEQGPTVQWGSHCKEPIPKIRNKYSQKRNCAATIPISTFMCLSTIYIFPRSICLFSCRKYWTDHGNI